MSIKTVREKKLANGTVRVTVDVPVGATLMMFHETKMYRLGGQLEEIVPAHVLTEIDEACWCHIEQKWNPV